jgi:hypothetical protein
MLTVYILSAVNLDLKGLVDWWRRRRRRRWRRGCWGTRADDTVIDVPVVSDNLLNNGRTDFWLRSWRRWWGRRRWGRRRGGSTLFLTPDNDLVSHNLAVVGGGRLSARAADDKLLALPSHQLAAVACRRGQAPLAASNRQRTPFSAAVSTIAAEFSAVCANLKLSVLFLEADRLPLSRDVAAMAADFAARSTEVDVVTSAASEAHFVVVHLTRGRSADGAYRGPITTAEDNVAALWGTPRLLAAADCDVVALNLAHRRGWWWGPASGRAYVIVETTGAAGSRTGEVVLITPSHDERAGGWAAVVVVQEVGHATAGVAAYTTTAQLKVELLIVAVAAAVAVEVALTLLIELCGGVASRHGAGEQQVGDGRGEGGGAVLGVRMGVAV